MHHHFVGKIINYAIFIEFHFVIEPWQLGTLCHLNNCSYLTDNSIQSYILSCFWLFIYISGLYYRRRLPVYVKRSHMVEDLKTAVKFVEQGRIFYIYFPLYMQCCFRLN